jgi:hypothetical protein
MPDIPASMTPQDALVAVMVAASASDENMRTAELVAIQRIVNHLPVFADMTPTASAASARPSLTCSRKKTGWTPCSA